MKANRTPEELEREQLKLEIAEELGLLDRVEQNGWKSLTAKETGRIGGMMTRRWKEHHQQSTLRKSDDGD